MDWCTFFWSLAIGFALIIGVLFAIYTNYRLECVEQVLQMHINSTNRRLRELDKAERVARVLHWRDN